MFLRSILIEQINVLLKWKLLNCLCCKCSPYELKNCCTQLFSGWKSNCSSEILAGMINAMKSCWWVQLNWDRKLKYTHTHTTKTNMFTHSEWYSCSHRQSCPQDGNFRISQLGAKPVKRSSGSSERLTATLTADLVKTERRGRKWERDDKKKQRGARV